jgi:glycosyltransferase involved in cell wall biosynthesis
MWRDRRVSVILPTFHERESIYESVREFVDTRHVDEVIVVNNNAEPGSSEEAIRAGARVVDEPVQGYGAAIRRGLAEATGELLVVSEPDGTFSGSDILKLLAYADDFDIVYGTRTSLQLIWGGANMGWFLRIGNVVVAKFAELLFNTSQLTDVGCTMRLLHRSAYEALAPHFTVSGSHFGPEMMALSFRAGLRTTQIPVNYKPRVGFSSVTGNKLVAIQIGLRMIWLLLRYRLGGKGHGKASPRDRWVAPNPHVVD